MSTMTTDRLAARTVSGVMAVMVAATAAATAVGFWLSYSGLHDFAVRAGLSGAQAWAWPASVDLFIVAGEAGVTISALCREADWGAWVYLVAGIAASVTGNVLHVHPGELAWPPYAVAAVPPIAAMAALAALLRIVYRLATDRAAAADTADTVATVTAREVAMARSGERAYMSALVASDRAREADRKRREADEKRREKAHKKRADREPKRTRQPVTGRGQRATKEAGVSALVKQPDMSAEDLAELLGVSVNARTVRRWREDARVLAASSNGHGTPTV